MLGFIKYLGYGAYNLAEHIYRGIVSIVYQTSAGDFVYTTDTSDNMVLVNSGDTGSVNNGLLYSGRGIELGALNDVTVGDAAKWTTYFDFATATHVKTFGVQALNTKTVNSILVSANEPSSETLSIFDANPNLVGKLAKSATGTIPEVDLELVASDSYYMCSEKSGAYIQDVRAGEINSITGLVQYTTSEAGNSVTIVGEDISYVNTVPELFSYKPMVNAVTSNTDFTQLFKAIYTITVTSGTSRFVEWSFGNGIDGTFAPKGVNTTLPVGTYTFSAFGYSRNLTGNTIGVELDGLNYPTFTADATLTVREATAIEIANYASTVRTNADFQQKGIQTTAFVTDGAGVPTAYSNTILNFTSLEYIDTQWNPSLESAFWIEEVIDGVVYQHKYDGVNLTTYTDNVAGTPTAHSPENASYLLGKGVYPKVTADPYTTYQSKTFQVYTGSTYTNYDQSSRYTILAAL